MSDVLLIKNTAMSLGRLGGNSVNITGKERGPGLTADWSGRDENTS
jgi:hypothetical protein